MTEWAFRNGAESDPVGCGEVCSHLWSVEHGTMANGPAAQEIWDELGSFESSAGLWEPLSELAKTLRTSEAAKFEAGPWTLGWHVYNSGGSKWMRFSEAGAATAPQVGWCGSSGSYYEDLLAPGESYGATPESGSPPQPKAAGWIYDGLQQYCNFGGIGYYSELKRPGCSSSISAPTPWPGWTNIAQQYGVCNEANCLRIAYPTVSLFHSRRICRSDGARHHYG